MLLRRRPPSSDAALVALLRRACRDARHPATRAGPVARYSSIARRHLSSITSSPTTTSASRPLFQYETTTAATTTTTTVVTKRHASTDTGPKNRGKGGRGSSGNKTPKKQVAVLGGGITGLTTAHYLARYAGNEIHVTLYEASDRLGGWIDGSSVSSAGSAGEGGGEGEDGGDGGAGEVLFQHGPRVLRSGISSNKYDDLVLYDVVSCCAKGCLSREKPAPSDRVSIFATTPLAIRSRSSADRLPDRLATPP